MIAGRRVQGRVELYVVQICNRGEPDSSFLTEVRTDNVKVIRLEPLETSFHAEPRHFLAQVVVLARWTVLAGLGDDLIRVPGVFFPKSLEGLAEDDLRRVVMRS
jgi:hypothetical protein